MASLPTVIVLAAGKGERFKASGSSQNKLNAMLSGQRVRDHVLAAVQSSGLPFHVVEREHTLHLAYPGMGDSIACGVAATSNASGWLILPADLPLIQSATLLAVAVALQQHAVVVPCYQGQKGHPVGFDASCRAALLQVTGEHGARTVVAQHTLYSLDVEDEGCVVDVDTVQALALAQSRLHQVGKISKRL